MMLLSDSVGGADERRNGFSNCMPVKVVVRSAIIPPENGDQGLGTGPRSHEHRDDLLRRNNFLAESPVPSP
jgi:hypothetical protein